MKDSDINEILLKADELRSLFVLGQRVIPFLEEIFKFMQEIAPVLNDINTSIQDNLKQMPKASQQLSKVTQATEMATTEIMDLLDGLVYKSNIISSNLSEAGKDSGTNADKLNAKSEEILESIRSDSMQMMMALQVQDITSQQLAAVNHLLQTVQDRLGTILGKFKKSDLGTLFETPAADDRKTSNISEMHRTIAFDAEAIDSLDPTKERQMDVDKIKSDFDSGKEIDTSETDSNAGTQTEDRSSAEPGSASSGDSGPASQSDIDALFASSDESSTDDAPSGSSEPTSQADIDALFGNSASSDDSSTSSNDAAKQEKPKESSNDDSHFSQDDIDAMFNNK